MTLPAATPGAGAHAGQRLVASGAPLSRARLAMVLLHGRGGLPEDILRLADHLAVPDVAVLAPEAGGRTWWPDSFLAPLSVNGAGLESALSMVAGLLASLADAGFGPDAVVLGGFSQGACLAAEAAARSPAPYRAVAVLSGGLVGTGETGGAPSDALYGRADKRFDYDGRLDRVPVLLGCHERDPHIPLARVRRSADVLGAMGAATELRVIPGAGHAVVAEEAAWLRAHIDT